MITYKVSTIGFYPEFDLLYAQIFGASVHCASKVQGNVAYYQFEQAQPYTDLAPMVNVEVVPNHPTDYYA